MSSSELHEEQLAAALSQGGLSRDPTDLEPFRPDPVMDGSAVAPSAVAFPANPDELEALVRVANDAGSNLVVAASGGPHGGRGLTSSKPHIVVDLSAWKAIPWLNRRNRVCLVEPGVTWGELLDVLAGHGMTVSMPIAPRSGKSVLASVLDRTPSTWSNRQWDSGDPVASTEFIFGNGARFRTGAAGGPGTLESQRAAGGAQKSPAGPSQTDFHRVIQGSQGTMGIATWIAVRAELKPSIQAPALVGADALADLLPFVYPVQRSGLGEHSFILDRNAAAMLMAAQTERAFEDVRSSLPAWVCLQNIAGFERLPEQRVEYQSHDIREIARGCGLALEPALGSVSAGDLLAAATTPGGETDWRRHVAGHCLSIFFLTTLDRAPSLVERFADLAGRAGLNPDASGCYVQPVVQNHGCHVELLVPFDPGVAREVERMHQLECAAVRDLAAAGAFFSRPYGPAAELAFRANPTGLEVLKKVKDIFDPRRVLNRGKWDL